MLDAEFERRSPERYRSLHRVIHDHAVAGLRAATGPDRQLLAQQLLFLHRKSPLTAAFCALRAQGSAAVVPARRRGARPGRRDHRTVRRPGERRARRAAGSPSSPTTSAWCAAARASAGFAYHVLRPSGSALEDRDPVVRAVLDHVAGTGPVRPGEQVDIVRFFGGRREHQRDPYAVLAGPVVVAARVGAPARSRGRSWSSVDAEFWGPFFDYMAFGRLLEVDGRRPGARRLRHRLAAHPGRRLARPDERTGALGRHRATAGRPAAPAAARPRRASPPPSGPRCSDLHRPDRLAASPLIGGPRWRRRPTAQRRPAPRARSRTPSAALRRTSPRATVLRAVLHRTFVRAAPTQEAAAEVLGLPFSTYRRHLAKALEQAHRPAVGGGDRRGAAAAGPPGQRLSSE